MLMKLLGIQSLFNALFDERWTLLIVPLESTARSSDFTSD
jgi:hypothetical protein